MASTRTTPRPSTSYSCLECGAAASKWVGRCESCGEWNTVVEEPSGDVDVAVPTSPATPITDVRCDDARPRATGVGEFDRVLGGGLVAGSVTLIGGEPGVGKSTLLLQVAAEATRRGGTALYLSGEESASQVARRARRIAADHGGVHVAGVTDLPSIIGHLRTLAPDVAVVDSIQTVVDPALSSAPGSVAQVRHCAHQLVGEARARGAAIVLVGHVTKEGAIAGPRVLEHVVDTVLSFDGDRHHILRLLRCVKHRFGSTHDVGVMAMGDDGLTGVDDPSELFLADRRGSVPGSVVVPIMDGHRPLLVEVQALLTEGGGGTPRRSSSGVDHGRLALLLAVIDARLGLSVMRLDTFAMAVGGARATEPGADLGLGLAIISAITGRSLPSRTVVCGEVGLGGELRSVSGIERRVAEAARLGFDTAVVPASAPDSRSGIALVRMSTLLEAAEALGLRRHETT